MPEAATNTIEKALAINLDPLKYGTIVEIGAGQEVARWFFQAGGAAGSIAKTMSAYDMDFSDEIYGVVSDRRYVSRARLERMLKHEFDLIISRISARRPEDSTFFAFANTVAARGYRESGECHGWLGVRLQLNPQSPPDDIILHVRMLDDTNLEQQEALGILGVNLIHGAYAHAHEPERLLRSLTDGLKWARVEIDLVEFSGPTLGRHDNRLMALELVKASLARAVLFNPKGKVVIPADALYKKKVLGMRGEFRPVTDVDMAMFNRARAEFSAGQTVAPGAMIHLAELTMAELANDKAVDTADFLSRVDQLTTLGFHVLISEYYRLFRVRQYLARHTREPVAIATDVNGFEEIIREDLYDGISGGLLEGLGQLFPRGTTIYIFPKIEGGKTVLFDDVAVVEHLQPLVSYLRGLDLIVPIDDFDPRSTHSDARQLAQEM